ncbi:MAG: DUF1820 family protein [Candidatus Competibacterales bacterium]|nr:DUF1820 family protein [Candidatus Competibacterales bacterium]
MARHKNLYKVLFVNQGKVFELYARKVYQGNLHGFVEVEELVFGTQASLVVDPSEERLRKEFADVRRTFLPLHAVIRIDEVEKEGVSKIRPGEEGGATIAPFPGAAHTPPRGGSRD